MLKKDIRAQKNELRAKMKCFRRDMPQAVKEKKDAAIRRGVQSLGQYQICQTLLTFVSTEIEVDTRVLIEQALRDGKRVAVPYCIEGTRQMDFYYIRSMADLVPRTFGVLEPLPEQCQKWTGAPNSICLVPGLAFDRQGHRMGYGGGFYDRYLAAHPHPTIALCYDFQLLPHLDAAAHDIPVDAVLAAPVPGVCSNRTARENDNEVTQ